MSTCSHLINIGRLTSLEVRTSRLVSSHTLRRISTLATTMLLEQQQTMPYTIGHLLRFLIRHGRHALRELVGHRYLRWFTVRYVELYPYRFHVGFLIERYGSIRSSDFIPRQFFAAPRSFIRNDHSGTPSFVQCTRCHWRIS